jgi:hypothetical protein
MISSEDWSRYLLAIAPFALVLGYREILSARAARWLLPIYLAASLFYAWNVIPTNLCPADLYSRVRQYLRL